MKVSFILVFGSILLMLTGCGASNIEFSKGETLQMMSDEGCMFYAHRDSISDTLSESYHWRKAYAEFLWDREWLDAELERQFTSLADENYEYYTPELGLIFLDSDDIPELLVYYRNDAPPAPEYYVIYHYVPVSKEGGNSVEVYYSGYSGIDSITWKYLPHGNAFYTGYYKCMGGLFDYDLFFLENGEWVNWDDVPVITSRIIAEHYGVFDGESINMHYTEPMFSNEWRTPELLNVWESLYYGDTRYSIIESMFGSNVVAGLTKDTK